MNPNTTLSNAEPSESRSIADVDSHVFHARFLQHDMYDHVVRNGPIHQRLATTTTTSSSKLPQEQMLSKSPLSIPGDTNSTCTEDATGAATTMSGTSSVSSSIFLLSYPTLEDLPADISVDEIFQQTNIVTHRHHRGQYQPSPQNNINNNNNTPPRPLTYHSETPVTRRDHYNVDDSDHNHNPENYSDSQNHHLEYINRYFAENTIEEEAYRTQIHPLFPQELRPQYDRQRLDLDHSDTEFGYREEHVDESDFDFYTNSLHHPQQQQHGEIVPVSLPELEETSEYSSSHQYGPSQIYESPQMDYDNFDNRHVRSGGWRPPYISSDTPMKQIPTIEISPGKHLPLRGADETMYAIESGFYVTIPCTICDQGLVCIANCELVLCPSCRVVSPNTTTILKQTIRRTTGMMQEQDDDDDETDVIVRLDVKSGVGLGLPER